MKMIAFVALLAGAAPLAAQDHAGHDGSGSPAGGLYTAEERAAGLREGRGMGLAVPAEANGYPGPRHVIELADQLMLSADQRGRTRQLFQQMEQRAQGLGQRLLAAEAALDAMFAERRATAAELDSRIREIARVEAELKLTHLATHLAMIEILSAEQVARYVALRRAGGGSGRTRPAPELRHDAH